jgi:glycosyltransferase involved in cell wall biosynthesis
VKKNIAILIPTLSNGGAERIASILSIYLPEDKYNKYLIVYDASKRDYDFKGKLINLNSKATHNPLKKIIIFYERIQKMKKLKRNLYIDTTISHLIGPNVVNVLSKSCDKVIVTQHNYMSKSSTGFSKKLYGILIKHYFNKADIVVGVSQLINKDLVTEFGIQESLLKAIYNAYDIDDIRSQALEELESEFQNYFTHPVIVTVGRLTRQKGQWHLIRFFKQVKEAIPDIKLIILGQGELEDYLKSLVRDLDLENDVLFLGFQRNPFKFIARSILFVMPSLYEGFPNTLAEAMACGVPALCADCKSGPREMLAPSSDLMIEATEVEYAEFGILAPVCDGKMYSAEDGLSGAEEIWSQSIIDIISDKTILDKYAACSRKRVEEFKIGDIIKQWESIF